MWIFTKSGFVSAVRKKENPDVLTVRARDRQSLEDLSALADSKIAKSPDADYPYRTFVSTDVFTSWLADAVVDLDYHNFKSAVSKSRGYEFTHALHDVWVGMLKVEDEDARQGVGEHIDLS
jgi:hypothetical protein